MNATGFKYVYGPVPSRRLGRSLGVDLVPFKTCTYDCIYCQLGRTTHRTTRRIEYVAVEEVLAELGAKLESAPTPDYVSLAGSGEPTLHARIGEVIAGVRRLTRAPVAVLTNGSLLWDDDVQEALLEADLVMPSLDAGSPSIFQRVNRPHPEIGFEAMVAGLAAFTARFRGSLRLEVMLVRGITGSRREVDKIAAAARRIRPERVQLNTVTRPPAEGFVCAVPLARLSRLAERFGGPVELISTARSENPPAPASSVVADSDLIELLARRPCTPEGVAAGLRLHIQEAVKRLESLAGTGAVRMLQKNGEVFYCLRREAAGEGGRHPNPKPQETGT
jgi:wyosine [tRNA(Phe)-imidazoG37] synthetase (radical SAM superfamily)